MNASTFLKKLPVQNAKSTFLLNFPYWVAAGISALTAVFYAKIFAASEAWGLAHSNSAWIFVFAPLSIVISFLIGHFISKEAIGSGIPQVIAAAEMAKDKPPLLEKLLSFKMIFAKIVGSCICVL